MSASLPSCSQPLYAVIDLGSNSFHMLITRLVADSVQVVDKVKRKVRLASGLDEQQNLDAKAMARGWECLSFFAERLQDIPKENIEIVATATLRLAKNADDFIIHAEQILQHKINLISGIQEAHNIYLGVAHTTSSADRRLVIDIGGASTEIIVGSGFEANQLCSLDMGCVTFNSEFFVTGEFTRAAFDNAFNKATSILANKVGDYKSIGWDVALGVSGTLQAVAEVLMAQGKMQVINLANLIDIEQQLIDCGSLGQLDNLVGLENERKPVFAPGIAILKAIVSSFDIEEVQLAGGAVREGVLYELLPNMRNVNIRQRTLAGLITRFSIDERQAYRVANIADTGFQHLAKGWQLTCNLESILQSACVLHEVGLALEYKNNKQHAQYILENSDLPGFSMAERNLLIALVSNYKTELNIDLIDKQYYTCALQAKRLIVILRLAIILSKRRKDDVLSDYHFSANETAIELKIGKHWLSQHPLIAYDLKQEVDYIDELGIKLNIVAVG